MLIIASVTLTPPPTIGESRIAVAAAPTCFGKENVTVGFVTYPPPPPVIVTNPTTPSPIVAVAAAPAPLVPPLENVTPGATVYPAPELTTFTACTDCSFGLAFKLQALIPPIMVATPTAVVPPEGAEVTPTVGI